MFENYHDIITVEDLAEILYIGKNKAYRLLKDGEIHAVRVGNTWRIPLSSVKEFIGRRPKPTKFSI